MNAPDTAGRPSVPGGGPGRRRTLGNGYIGRLERAPAFDLRPGVLTPGDVGLTEAVRLVVDEYGRQLAAGTLSRRTCDSYGRLAGEVGEFASQQGACRLLDVDEDIVGDYVFSTNAPGTRRPGLLPLLDTTNRRRSGVRALFLTARLLGLDDRDPSAHLLLPSRTSPEPRPADNDPDVRGPEGRPLTRQEARRCRVASRYRHDDSRLPATAALLLAGAGTGGAHRVQVRHLALDRSLAWCPGAGRAHGRWLPLDAWAVEALADHRLYLSRRIRAADLPGTAVVHVGPSRSRRKPGAPKDPDQVRQSEMGGLARRLLRKAGLLGTPGVRPASLAEHAAVIEFERTGRLEAAATVLGVASLDATAAVLGYAWRDEHRLAPPFDGADA